MIKIDVSEIIELGRAFTALSGGVLEENLRQGVFIAGAEVQKEARGLVPTDTGALRLSIENTLPIEMSAVSAEVGPAKQYGKEIEFGRPPGTFVSAAALSGWAKRKGLNPYAVSWAIHKKGSPPQPFMFPAADAKENEIPKIIAQAFQNAVEQAFK